MMTRLLAAAAATTLIAACASAQAPCNPAAVLEQCKAQLDEGFQVMNAYSLASEEGKPVTVTDDHVLSSRMAYQMVICGSDDVEFGLETGARKPVADNKAASGLQNKMAIEPPRTSLYYLTFNAPANSCAAAVVGMKR